MNYKFIGERGRDEAGWSVSSAGDVDGDGQDDLLIGAYREDSGGSNAGATYLVDADALAAADAADGTIDGVIDLSNVAAQAGSYKFIGELAGDQSGWSVSSAGDVDGDGQDDLLIGAYWEDSGGSFAGATYLVDADALAAADAADGTSDGVIDLSNVAAQAGSYKFVGEEANDGSGVSVSSAGDVDGDGQDDLLIGAQLEDSGGSNAGATYLLDADDLAAADAADGTIDGVIDLANVAAQAGCYKFIGGLALDQSGYSVSSAGDVDGDGQDDLLIGATEEDSGGSNAGATYLLNADDLAAADAADGTSDGVIDLSNVAAQAGSYKFIGEEANDQAGWSVSSAGDVDGDGQDDLLIGAPQEDSGGTFAGATYLIDADDLVAADAADGTSDGVIDLSNVAAQAGSYKFIGELGGDESGWSVSSAGDVDGDGQDDLLIGAPQEDSGGTFAGAAYLIVADDLAAADAADGTSDGVIDLANVPAQAGSYKFIGERASDQAGWSVSSAGDVDGDGQDDLLIGARLEDSGGSDAGATYLFNADDLAAADAADGTSDGVIDLANAMICFAPGTRIATPGAEQRVDDLRIGDLILAAGGRTVPIRWIGRRTVRMRQVRVPERLEPVRIRAGALGGGLPHSDLTVTADHGMIVDGLVINASALVNGASIAFVPHSDLPDQITYFHIETEAHDVILANGAPAETFVDYVQREAFDNYQEYLDLYGADRIIWEMARPRIGAQRLVPNAIKARLGIVEEVFDFDQPLSA